ncbi:MAG: FAD:protein FMN transferase [Bacteroidales bacterium]|nr:FAD:protein FMN transferase [Bacteroidales bacterium]
MRRMLAILLLGVILLACGRQPGRYVQISGTAQGGTYSVKLNLKGVNQPVEAVRDSIDALLRNIDQSLSGYNKSSLLSRFNAGEVIRPNALFIDMYSLAYRYWERSGGALDFAAGPLYDAWGFGFRSSSFPTDAEVAALLGTSGLDRLPRELPLRPDGTLDPAAMGSPRLNYNAIAQGYSCDIIARYLYGLGVRDMLVDIGEIWCDGVNPAGQPWSVGLDRPVEREPGSQETQYQDIWSSGGTPCGITTSGNYRKFYVRDGRKYAHTIDPRSGYPVQHNLLSATVVSQVSAAESDAVATWCMVVGLEAAQLLILEDPALEGYLVYTDAEGRMQEWYSPGFQVINR